MSIAGASLAQVPVADGAGEVSRLTKVPRKRRTVAVAAPVLMPEAR